MNRLFQTISKPLFLLLCLSAVFATASAQNDFEIKFCDRPRVWCKLIEQNKVDYRCYIHITPAMATQIAGNKLTEISFSATSDFQDKPRQGTVFVCEDINGEPVTVTNCEVVNSESKGHLDGKPWQTVALEEPYTIKAGTGFWFGYTVESCRWSASSGNADYPVAIDNLQPNGFSGQVEIRANATGELLQTYDMDKLAESNLFLTAKTVGDAEGFSTDYMIGNLRLRSGLYKSFTMPIFTPDELPQLVLPVTNNTTAAITSMEYTLDINGQKEHQQISLNIEPSSESVIELPTPNFVSGRNTITLNVKKINGTDRAASSTESCMVIAADEGFERKFVMEEGTGTWCGWCPRGIVGMEEMLKKYPERFIGIAVHSGDAMAVSSYGGVHSFFAGYPSCVINRDPLYVFDPATENLEVAYDAWLRQRTIAKLDVAAEIVDEGFKVSTETTFAFPESNADYRQAFVIMEDGLTDRQTNYYSGNPDGLEWWRDQDKVVNWTYEHTARDIFNYNGLSGSLPATITAGETVSFNAILKTENVSDKLQTSIVALLLDGKSGIILNAAKVGAKDYKNYADGISTATAMPGEAAVYYNLQGMRIEKPAIGSVVIRSIGGKRNTIIVKP